MGFNKRYITKDLILLYIEEDKNLNGLLKADSLIMDNWSYSFFNNYDSSSDYKKIRDELNSEVVFSSNLTDITNHYNFNKLRKLSNILENLIKHSSWTDVLLADTFNFEKPNYLGNFEMTRQFYIDAIINLYTNQSRDKIISEILNGTK